MRGGSSPRFHVGQDEAVDRGLRPGGVLRPAAAARASGWNDHHVAPRRDRPGPRTVGSGPAGPASSSARGVDLGRGELPLCGMLRSPRMPTAWMSRLSGLPGTMAGPLSPPFNIDPGPSRLSPPFALARRGTRSNFPEERPDLFLEELDPVPRHIAVRLTRWRAVTCPRRKSPAARGPATGG